MALTETRTVKEDAPAGATAQAATFDAVIGTGDHKTIGRVFIGSGVLFLLGSLVVAVVGVFMANNFDGLDDGAVDTLPQVWSLGRDLTLFGGVVPILMGLAVYLVPLQVGAPSLAFARGAAASLWTWLLGTGLLIVAYIFNGGPGGGRRDFVVLWAFSLAMMVGALVWTMICITTTILGARTKGMTLERVPVTSWGFFVFSLVGIFSLPILMGELLLSYLRIRYLHLPIEESAQLTGVMDGFSLAPALYWVGIPVLAMAAEMIAVHTDRPLAFHKPIMMALGLFGILTFGADVVGLASVRGVDFNNALLTVGLFAVIVPILATLALAGDSIRFGAVTVRTALVGALVSGLLLLLAAVVSLLATIEPIMGFLDEIGVAGIDMTNTLILNGTRFHEGVRALVVGAAVVSIIAAVHHWGVKIWGRRLAESLGSLSVAAAAAGSIIWAIGEIAAGYDDQPWLPARSTDGFAEIFGVISLVGVAVLAVGVAVLALSMATSLLGGKVSGSAPNAWVGSTLEWATPNPPPVGNFPAPPIVQSASPLADGEVVYAGQVGSDESGSDGSDSNAEED